MRGQRVYEVLIEGCDDIGLKGNGIEVKEEGVSGGGV